MTLGTACRPAVVRCQSRLGAMSPAMAVRWDDDCVIGLSTKSVGREVELAILRAAASGLDDPGVVLIAGEAGIGKSYLIAKFGQELQSVTGVRVVVGGCVQLGGDPILYAPLAE